MREHSPESGSGTQILLQLFRALATIWVLFDALILDAGYVSDYLCVRLVNMRISISQDLLQAGETNVSAGRATMLVTVLLGTHRTHH